MKLIWKVAPAPTGRYRSFEKRGWPTAKYQSGDIAACISCEDDYNPANVRAGAHSELTVRVADWSVTPWKWRTLKARFNTLDEAKKAAVACLIEHQRFQPNLSELD